MERPARRRQGRTPKSQASPFKAPINVKLEEIKDRKKTPPPNTLEESQVSVDQAPDDSGLGASKVAQSDDSAVVTVTTDKPKSALVYPGIPGIPGKEPTPGVFNIPVYDFPYDVETLAQYDLQNNTNAQVIPYY